MTNLLFILSILAQPRLHLVFISRLQVKASNMYVSTELKTIERQESNKQTFHHLSPNKHFTTQVQHPSLIYLTELLSEGGRGDLLKNLFQPQPSAHVTLCSPPFLVIPNFSDKSSVYSLHISSTKAPFSFYIKITGESQQHVREH